VGNVFVAEKDGYKVRVVSTTGILTTFAGTGMRSGGNNGDGWLATKAQLQNPYGIAMVRIINLS